MSSKAKNASPFPGQRENEEAVFVFRQHPLVMRIPFIFGLLAMVVGTFPLLAWPLSNIALYIALLTPLVAMVYWLYHWIGWYYSVYIVTDERFIMIKQKGLFNRRVTEFDHDKIQSINYHIKGLEAVMFKFGDINIQTYIGDVTLETIPNPVDTHEKLNAIARKSLAGLQK